MPANNTDIEKRLWDAADELRANSRLRPSEYYLPVLGLIFLRYADHKFTIADGEIHAERAAGAPSPRPTITPKTSSFCPTKPVSPPSSNSPIPIPTNSASKKAPSSSISMTTIGGQGKAFTPGRRKNRADSNTRRANGPVDPSQHGGNEPDCRFRPGVSGRTRAANHVPSNNSSQSNYPKDDQSPDLNLDNQLTNRLRD